jgi:hypothetical protein
MASGRRILPALVVAAVGALACGKSAQQKEADRLEAECDALVLQHETFGQAAAMFLAADVRVDSNPCPTNLAPLAGGNDVCGDPTAGICQTLWYFFPNDPGLCGPNGCWLVCEARMTLASINAGSSAAPVCASRFFREQPPPL